MALPSALIVLQARFSSTRCPGKVLADVAGRPMLAYCVARLRAAGAGDVLVATSVEPEDEAVAGAGAAAGAAVVRGPLDDVLGRFALAVRDWPGEAVIRATADNPAVDIEAVGRVLQHLAAGADYVVETGLPVGGAVEGVRTDVLRRAAAVAVDPYEREHVTPYVRRRPEEFVVALPFAPAPLRRPDVRLTVDTPADLAFVRRVFGVLRGDALAPLSRIIDVAESLRGGGGPS